MTAHLFKKKHFNRPTWCAFCEKFIWGLGKQGYCCKLCNYPCHPKCRNDVTCSCPEVKTNWGRKILDTAKERENANTGKDNKKTSLRSSKPEEIHDNDIPEVDTSEQDTSDKQSKVKPVLSVQPTLMRIANGTKKEVAKTFDDVYDVHEKLGSGAFAIVHKVQHKESKKVYAAKMICKKNVTSDTERLAIELEVLQRVNHPNIIHLEEVFETEDMLYIVTEIVTGGELFDRIVSRGSYTESDAANLVRKVIEALAYLHDLGIVHRDLKPENLLLKSQDNDIDVKIADFGLSKIIGAAAMTQTACGTPGYVAPEILKGSGYGKEVDMWSVGVITYILLCGFPPFYNENVAELFESIINADFDYPSDYWDHISDDAIDFIDNLLVADPAKRMTATSALQHSWLQGNAPATPLKGVPQGIQKYQSVIKEQSKANMAD